MTYADKKWTDQLVRLTQLCKMYAFLETDPDEPAFNKNIDFFSGCPQKLYVGVLICEAFPVGTPYVLMKIWEMICILIHFYANLDRFMQLKGIIEANTTLKCWFKICKF